ncbi:GntR family transcriptional regulator [Listeria aquatica]|uniref:GntR family transcriptional regulator n=1 Tax=Listeria aquatica FSL S10-1188 TaxID=1265818 RepID=W7BAE3_9LIST|nr:GntR family transcriptional regulator [Listeria aquatica]EUJ19861.1 GntR family transcriptional regulator [Listeria aquatica FSL S10-1188]
MLLQINLEAEEPIYMQIRNQVIEGIAKGEFSPGEKLPSVRSLAADIGINFHTVNKAYQLLAREGLIEIHRKQGVSIPLEGVQAADATYLHALNQKLRPIVAEAIARSVSEQSFMQECKLLYHELQADKQGKEAR